MAKLDISPQKYYVVTCLPQSGCYFPSADRRLPGRHAFAYDRMDASEADVQLDDFGEY